MNLCHPHAFYFAQKTDTKINDMGNALKKMRIGFSCSSDVEWGEDAPAGSADVVSNLRAVGTMLQPVGQTTALAQTGGDTLLATHRTADGVNILTLSESGTVRHLGTFDGESYTAVDNEIGTLAGDVLCAETLGDFVVVGCSAGDAVLHYSDGAYTLLDIDKAVPELYLHAEVAETATETVPEYQLAGSYDHWQSPLDSEDVDAIASNLRSAWSRIQATASAQRAMVQPVLARYGVRLWDDNYLWVSQPVAIGRGLQGTGSYTADVENDGDYYTTIGSFDIEAEIYDIAARVVTATDASWDHLIKSIDILVSSEADPFLSGQSITYRCATSSSGTKSSYLVLNFTARAGDVVISELTGTETWTVKYRITDLAAMREGTVTLCPMVSEITADAETLSLCTHQLARLQVSTSLMPHNRNLFSAGATSLLRAGWSMVPSIVVDTDTFDDESYQVVAVTQINTTHGTAVTVWTGSGCGRPTALNPLVAYPDSRATDMQVTVMLDDGTAMEASLSLHPATAEGFAFVAGDSLENIELADSDITELPETEQCGIEEPVAGNVLQSAELNPLVTAQTHTVADGQIRAIGAAMHRNGSQIGTPLYVFTDGGIYAMPYRISSASYAPAVMVATHVVASGVKPARSSDKLYFFTTDGELCSISQYKVARELQSAGDVTAMAFGLPHRELWMLLADGSVTALTSQGRTLTRTDELTSLFTSSADWPLAVDGDGWIRVVNAEARIATEVEFLSEPFSPSGSEWFAPRCVTLLMTAQEADIEVTVYGETGHSCHGMTLCRLSVSGAVNSPVPFMFYSPDVRKMRLGIVGTVSSDAVIAGATITYRPS